MEKLAWLVPALPMVAWAVLLLVGKRLAGGGAAVGIFAVAVGWVISLAILVGVIGGADAYHASTEWAPIGAWFDIPFGMTVDGLAAVLLVVVTTVSLLVQLYSVSYMRGDERYTFFFAKAVAVHHRHADRRPGRQPAADAVRLGDHGHLLVLPDRALLGGLANARAAIKAFLTTRVGDLGFMAGIFVFAWAARSFEIQRIIDGVETGQISSTTVTLGAALLFCGASASRGSSRCTPGCPTPWPARPRCRP